MQAMAEEQETLASPEFLDTYLIFNGLDPEVSLDDEETWNWPGEPRFDQPAPQLNRSFVQSPEDKQFGTHAKDQEAASAEDIQAWYLQRFASSYEADRVPIWNRYTKSKITGDTAPRRKILPFFLASNPGCEVYDGQDSRPARESPFHKPLRGDDSFVGRYESQHIFQETHDLLPNNRRVNPYASSAEQAGLHTAKESETSHIRRILRETSNKAYEILGHPVPDFERHRQLCPPPEDKTEFTLARPPPFQFLDELRQSAIGINPIFLPLKWNGMNGKPIYRPLGETGKLNWHDRDWRITDARQWRNEYNVSLWADELGVTEDRHNGNGGGGEQSIKIDDYLV